MEHSHITKHNVRNTVRHIMVHISQCLCVFLHGIIPCGVQHDLRRILSLFQKLMDTPADILPGEKRLI